jgi:hypothetical protein
MEIVMETVKAIETFYKGYHFRSRLEARWAVFFDTLGIPWKYEDEGFEKEVHGETVRYLPDFFLPYRWGGGGFYVEVKGDTNALKKDWEKHAEMHDFGGILPNFSGSYGEDKGLILLSEIPEPSNSKAYFHPILQHYKGLVKSYGSFTPHGFAVVWQSELASLLAIDPIHGLDSSGEDWDIDTHQVHTYRHHPTVVNAYAAARSARFEHGQRGAA